MKTTFERVTLVLLILVVVSLLAGGSLQTIAAAPEGQQTTFDSLRLLGDLTVVDDASIGDDLTVTGSAVVDDVFNVDDTATTISGTQTITPANSFLTVAPTVLSTITVSAAGCSNGDLLVIVNTVATNTNIVDTGATVGGGAIDLGANDMAVFMCVSATWVEVASPDNS